jgi:hypothetical protein
MKKAAEAGLKGDRLLSDIDREAAKAVRDLMLKTEKKGGGIITVSNWVFMTNAKESAVASSISTMPAVGSSLRHAMRGSLGRP